MRGSIQVTRLGASFTAGPAAHPLSGTGEVWIHSPQSGALEHLGVHGGHFWDASTPGLPTRSKGCAGRYPQSLSPKSPALPCTLNLSPDLASHFLSGEPSASFPHRGRTAWPGPQVPLCNLDRKRGLRNERLLALLPLVPGEPRLLRRPEDAKRCQEGSWGRRSETLALEDFYGSGGCTASPNSSQCSSRSTRVRSISTKVNVES